MILKLHLAWYESFVAIVFHFLSFYLPIMKIHEQVKQDVVEVKHDFVELKKTVADMSVKLDRVLLILEQRS